jgi:hypothetical protein
MVWSTQALQTPELANEHLHDRPQQAPMPKVQAQPPVMRTLQGKESGWSRRSAISRSFSNNAVPFVVATSSRIDYDIH